MDCPNCGIGKLKDEWDIKCNNCGGIFELIFKHTKHRHGMNPTSCIHLDHLKMCSANSCGSETMNPIMGRMCCMYCAHKESCDALCRYFADKLEESTYTKSDMRRGGI